MLKKKSVLVLVVVIIALLAVAPSAFARIDIRTRTMMVCYTANEDVTLYDFVDMSALGLTAPELNGGVLLVTQMAGDVVEYGYYTADYGYQVLGWGWITDDVQYYSANENGMLSQAQLEAVMAAFGPGLRPNCVEKEIEIAH